MSTLLYAEGLKKVFRRSGAGELRAVDGVNFTVHRGDVFGFLGPNGAGKSTTIRMLLGLIHPSAGFVTIGGFDVQTQRLQALRKVGAFVEAPAFYSYLTGRQNLEIFAGLSGGVSAAELLRVVDLVGLAGRENDPVKIYSHGMRQRLGIASCLLPRPELLVLDEPTDGLDPHGIREIRKLILRLAHDEKLTIFLSSHLLGEVESICNRVAILERGRVILHGELAELEQRLRLFEIDVDRPVEAAALLKERFGIDPQPHAERAGALQTVLKGTDKAALNAELIHNGFPVRGLAPEANWLQRVFLELTSSKEQARRDGSGGDSGAHS